MEMLTISISIIAVVMAAFISFAVFLNGNYRLPNFAFTVSLLSTSAAIFSDSMSVFNPDFVDVWKRVTFLSESIMVSSWLLFALSFARLNYWGTINLFSKLLIFLSPLIIIYFTTVPIENFFYSPEFEDERVLFLDNMGYTFNLLLLLYSIMSIVSLEATLKSSTGTDRWQIKYMMIGVGGILAINVFYYSHALLYRSIDMNLLPVRSVVILISLLLIGYSLLKHKIIASQVSVAVSRKVFYRSLSIFFVGIYLLGLGLIGEGMRYFGPKVGRNIATFLGFAGAITVLAIILSEKLRRKTMVFINKHFYSHKYDYREQWLQFTQRISLKHSFEELLGAIVEGFIYAISSRGAGMWLKEKENEYVCVKTVDIDMVKIKPNSELIKFFNNKKWILNIHDMDCKDIVDSNEEFIKHTRAFLIVPLLNVDELIGFIVLREGLASYEYNYEDYDLLKTLARQATAAILNARLSEELTEAKEMEAVGRLSSFIIHDLKNTTSMLSLIAHNAEEHIDNPDFQRDAIKAIANTSEKIKNIIGKLKNLPQKTTLDFESVDLGEVVKTSIKEINLNGDSRLSFKELEPVRLMFDRDEISKVIINLIINAIDAADNKGVIDIVVGTKGNMGFVKVSDNGCGMSEEFIEKRLFRPFQTTKKKGLGIGLYQCKTIVDVHSGSLKVVSKEGKGTDFTMYLPLSGQ